MQWDFTKIIELRKAERRFNRLLAHDSLFNRGKEGEIFKFGAVHKTSYRIKIPDDIYTIAQDHGITWQSIAEVNRLDYPYIVQDISEYPKNLNIKQPGDYIQLVVESPRLTSDNIENNKDAEAIFGCGWEIDVDGKLVWDEVNNDFKINYGLEHALHCIDTFFRTTPGDVRENPNYGDCFNELGFDGRPQEINLRKLKMKMALKADPFVRDVLKFDWRFKDGALNKYVQISLANVGKITRKIEKKSSE